MCNSEKYVNARQEKYTDGRSARDVGADKWGVTADANMGKSGENENIAIFTNGQRVMKKGQ